MRVLQQLLSPEEFTELLAYERIAPRGPYRDDARTLFVAAAARSAMGGRGPDGRAFFPHLERGSGTEIDGSNADVVAAALMPPAVPEGVIRERKGQG